MLTPKTDHCPLRAPAPAPLLAAAPSPRIAALTTLAAAALLTCTPLAARAQAATATAATPPAATPLAEIVNIVTRTERAVDAVPATVTVETAEQIERRGARDLKDLLRNEVDVTVRAPQPRFGLALGSAGRAGNEGINIRGLEGNQVLMLVDGIRLPQRFEFGPFVSGRADTLLLDGAQTIEILRGPASAQFGSDGLAGALAVRTLEPADLLRPGRDRGGFARIGGTTLDDSLALTVAGAWRAGAWSALLLGSQRSGHETDNQGRNEAADTRRTAPNPLDYRQRGALAKLRHQLTPAHQVGLTLETVRREVDVEVLSARTVLPPPPPPPPPRRPPAVTLDFDARDRVARDRASVEWTYDDVNAALVQRAEARLYVQDASTRQRGSEIRQRPDPDRARDNRYRERVVGLIAQAQASVGGALPQRLSAGVDASQTRVSGLLDGVVPPVGESFPLKPFPDTDFRLLGAFVQSEVELGALTLIPALRFDRYEIDPSPAGFLNPVAASSGQAFTPRLGALWQLTDAVQAYGQWARGFRAPTPGQVNTRFENPIPPPGRRAYRSIANPDLRPERAQSFELGLRGRSEGLRWQIAVFDNRYRDFISQEIVDATGPLDIFQFINLASARVRGAEARLHWQPAPGWQLNAQAAQARGHRERAGVRDPLDTIEPTRIGAGVRHEHGAWQWRADVLHVRAKAAERARTQALPNPFVPPAYTVVDVGASWRVHRDVTLHFNVENLFDRTYWRWSDVRGIPATSAVLDAFTAPGRSFNVAARIDF